VKSTSIRKLPIEIRCKLFLDMTADIGKRLRAQGLTQKEIEREFATYQKRCRR
jgi:hypothetical protein